MQLLFQTLVREDLECLLVWILELREVWWLQCTFIGSSDNLDSGARKWVA